MTCCPGEAGERRELRELIAGYLEHAAPAQDWDARGVRGIASAGGGRTSRGPNGRRPRESCRSSSSSSETSGRSHGPTSSPASPTPSAYQGRREKVASYYHRLERGMLPAEGVSARVWEALASCSGHKRGRAAKSRGHDEATTDPRSRVRLCADRSPPTARIRDRPIFRGANSLRHRTHRGTRRGGPAVHRRLRWRCAAAVVPGGVEQRAETVLAEVPDWIWNGEELPVPVENIADCHFGLLIRDVEDMTSAPGAPELREGSRSPGSCSPARARSG